MPAFRQCQQGCFVRFAIGAGHPGHGFDRQSGLVEHFLDRPFHQIQACISLAAHTQPEAGRMPGTGLGGFRPDADGSLCIGIHRLNQALRCCPVPQPLALTHGHLGFVGLLLHQSTPGFGRSASSPAPGFSEAIEGQAPFAGAGPRQHSCPLQFCGQFPSPLLGPAAMAPQQGHYPMTVGIQDENSGIVVFPLDERCDQARHSSDCSDHQQGFPRNPVTLQQFNSVAFGTADNGRLTAAFQAIQH